jgi:N-acetylneuraminic acid mutarotase
MVGFLGMAFVAACTDNDNRDPTAPTSPEVVPEGTEVSAAVAANSWSTKRSMLLPARAHMKAAMLNGIIYVVGGDDISGEEILRNFDAYSVASNTWTTRRPLPGGRSFMCGLSVIGGKLYTTGGFRTTTGGKIPTRSLYVYTPGTNTWDKKANIPVDALRGTQGVIAGKLYVHIGTISLGADSVFFRYDPATNTWIKRRSPPNQHLQGQAEVINGKYYLVGGVGGPDLEPTTRLDVYDPATNTWTQKASMATGRLNFASGVINGKLYVSGGFDSGGAETFASTEVYDPATNTWSSKAPMPTPQQSMASAVGGSRLFVMGGSDGFGLTRRVQAFFP